LLAGCTLLSGQKAKWNFRPDKFSKGESEFMAKLTAATRKKISKSDFADKANRKYPIEDAAHARDALARSSGKPVHAKVVAAVKRKYPKIKIKK
jgi:hypothetical protein